MAKILEKIIRISIYSLVFLLPLFWLPFSFEILEFPKQYLLLFLTTIPFLAWIIKMIFFDREIKFLKSPLNIPVLIFLLVAIVSAIFSVDKYSSLLGFYGRFSNGLIGLLSLGLFYFLIINNFNQNEIKSILKIFLFSVFFIVLITYFSIFGLWQKLSSLANLAIGGNFNLPNFVFQRIFNPVSGSLEGLAIFLSIIIVLLVGLLLNQNSRFQTIFHWILLVTSFGLLIIINFFPTWFILIFSLSPGLIFALKSRIFKENVNRLLLPICLIILAVLFLFIDTSKIFSFQRDLLKEQSLEQKTSWKVAFGTTRENLKNFFLGSGIGTFQYDFLKQKPVEFNQSPWWQIRFDRSGNHISEILATMGFLGILPYLILIIIFFLVSLFLSKNPELFSLTMTMVAIFISQFLYYQNTVLAFTFWFILGLFVVSWQNLTKKNWYTLSFKDFPELSLIFSTFFIIVSFGILVICYFGIRFFIADLNYAKTQFLPLTKESTEILERTVSMNPNLSHYRIILARALLFQVLEELGKSPTNQDQIQSLIIKAIEQANKATEYSPNNIAGWETLGIIYRDIRFLVQGADEFAIKSFEKAVELEPKNPVLYTEIGKLYLDSLNDIQKAEENFSKAKELKPDYVEALIQDALIDESGAISKIEEIVSNYPRDIEARFQLARLYFNKNRLDEAIFQFESIVQSVPNHSNSLYSLGLAYAKKGDKEKAISYLEKVLELNPGNQDIIKKIEEIRGEK